MSNQTAMNGAKANAEETPARSVARNTGEFLHALVTLGELQLRLLILDGQEGLRRFIWPLVAIVGGLAIGLAAIPVLLIAFALTLTEVLQFTPAQATGIAAGVGLLIAALFVGGGWLGWRAVRGGMFERSQREWTQNVRWIKDALQRSNGDPVPSWARKATPFSKSY